MKILNIVGARPNFMKMAPLIEALNDHPAHFEHLLVHTGQHYDQRMSKAFFDDLGMPRPDIDLGVGSGSHAEQTARIMTGFEKVCLEHKPDLVIVAGDVNSTMACAITAKKLGIRVAHIEAGLRSRDMAMPEEINRLCTDVLSDLLFTTDRGASENLRKEGVAQDKIHFVGNVMIDTLLKHRELAKELPLMDRLGLAPRKFAMLTLHRPSNVDDREIFRGVLEALHEIGQKIPVIFPIHPRTRKMVEQFGFDGFFNSGDRVEGVWLTEPLSYLEFLHLNMNARMILTDSGGLQEESTVLGIPCLTLRFNTERPVTCEQGTSELVGNDPQRIREAASQVLDRETSGAWTSREMTPELWDGKTAQRIVEVLMRQSD